MAYGAAKWKDGHSLSLKLPKGLVLGQLKCTKCGTDLGSTECSAHSEHPLNKLDNDGGRLCPVYS